MDATYTGKQISDRRKSLGLTQKELAEKLHVTDKAVSKWERGVNFPDLGLMESLAEALETSPATLLGLENANHDEIVSSITQISNEQLEDARNDMKWIGWISIAAAVMLTIAYTLFGNDIQRTQNAYLILHCVILAIAIGGIYLLVKYGQIKKFTTMDICALYTAMISVLVILGIQFFTGYSPNTVLALCLFSIAACNIQLLFCRIMTARLAQALPLILSAGYAIWLICVESFSPNVIALSGCCLVIWILYHAKILK